MRTHTVTAFDSELKSLNGGIEEMGSRTIAQIDGAVDALVNGRVEVAQDVIAGDRALDELQQRVEAAAVEIIAKRQPVASDLREVVTAMRIASDLERIGDLAKNVAKRSIAIGASATTFKVPAGLGSLAERVRAQLAAVLAANRAGNDAEALAVWRADSAIDALHTSLFREMLTYMMEDPRSIGLGTHLLFCAKNLERMGDHATNIAETVHYRLTSEFIASERPKGDLSSDVRPKADG
jgi:phosphate transport system protein